MDEEEIITYTAAGDLRDTDYEGEVWETAYSCDRCHALVASWNMDGHTEWHRKLGA